MVEWRRLACEIEALGWERKILGSALHPLHTKDMILSIPLALVDGISYHTEAYREYHYAIKSTWAVSLPQTRFERAQCLAVGAVACICILLMASHFHFSLYRADSKPYTSRVCMSAIPLAN